MEKEHYTLNDPIFLYGLSEGANSQDFFDDKREIMIVGGAACQLNMRNKPSSLRPTTDIDIISNLPTNNREKKLWAAGLEQKITANSDYSVKGGLTRYGSEVRFTNSCPDFILHLDCVTPTFFNRHQKRIKSEYERAEIISIHGKNVRYHSPTDIILNKIRRIKNLESANLINLDPTQNYLLALICDGQFDDAYELTKDVNLDKVLKTRNQTVEDLGRYGYKQIIQEIENYKLIKDLYDISGMVNSIQESNNKLSRKEFKEGLGLVLLE